MTGPLGGWVPTRRQPRMPVQAMQTYAIARPVGSHTRRASCREVDCLASARGWSTSVDVSTELGRRQANYIRLKSGRSFSIMESGDLVTFTFPAGQICFSEHRVVNDRPALFVKQGGDWRARTTDPALMRDVDWVDDFANHQANLAERIERG